MSADRVRCERPAEGIARVVLARPEQRNAQDRALLYALDDALTSAARDDDVRVIVLAADGPDFSSGHDLRGDYSVDPAATRAPLGGFEAPGAEGWLNTEEELFVGLCLRWRDLPKPLIAQVQGKVIAGGLMLVWPCDLVVASEDASFRDPVTAFGVGGHEYFTHLWELGHRRAKEMLFTGEAVDARDALALGMVNRVVAPDRLEAETLALAEAVARRPPFGVRLAKRAINHGLDLQGQRLAIDAAFGYHHLAHSHNRELFGNLLNPEGAAVIRRDAQRPRDAP